MTDIETTPSWSALAELACQIRDPIPDTPPTPPAEVMGSLEAIAQWLGDFERQHAPEAERLIVEAVNAGAHMEIPSEAVGFFIRERMNFAARTGLMMGAEFFPHGSLAEAVLWLNGHPWEACGRLHFVDNLAGAWWLAHQERRAGEQSVLNILNAQPPQNLAWLVVDCDVEDAGPHEILDTLHEAMREQNMVPELNRFRFSFGAVALARCSEKRLEQPRDVLPLIDLLRRISSELAVEVVVGKNEAVFADPSDELPWPYVARYAFLEMGQSLHVAQPVLERYLVESGLHFIPGQSGVWFDDSEGVLVLYNTRDQHRLMEVIVQALAATAEQPTEEPGLDDPLEGMS